MAAVRSKSAGLFFRVVVLKTLDRKRAKNKTKMGSAHQVARENKRSREALVRTSLGWLSSPKRDDAQCEQPLMHGPFTICKQYERKSILNTAVPIDERDFHIGTRFKRGSVLRIANGQGCTFFKQRTFFSFSSGRSLCRPVTFEPGTIRTPGPLVNYLRPANNRYLKRERNAQPKKEAHITEAEDEKRRTVLGPQNEIKK